MNETQKRQIEKMRGGGISYSVIARSLDISVNTVKSYCRRNSLKGATESPEAAADAYCKQCGKPLTQTPGRRKRKFCGDDCRKTYWKENQDKIVRRSAVTLICPVCHKPFSDYAKNNRKYCSPACYAARNKGGDGDK